MGGTDAPSGLRARLAEAGADLLRVRWFVRALIWLYRARLGAIFGGRLLMLEPRGRRFGKRHYVVLEVVEYPRPDSYVVVSGFGRKAQWYRNIEADPEVRVWLCSRCPAGAEARPPEAEEAAALRAGAPSCLGVAATGVGADARSPHRRSRHGTAHGRAAAQVIRAPHR